MRAASLSSNVIDHSIGDELLPREILGITARNGMVGESGESTHRVEMEAVVTPRPGTAQSLILLENNRLDSTLLERARGGQPGGSRAYDDDRGLWQESFLSRKSASRRIR